MRRRFYGIFVGGIEHLEAALSKDSALIICTNHSNWWDGFAVGLLAPLFPERRIFVAQYEKLLERYRPLRWLGAFGLDLDGSALPGLRHAMMLLRDPRTVVWIFPQGVLVPQWSPIIVKPGAMWLARRCRVGVLPVVLRYEWLVESRPSLFVQCGAALEPGATPGDLQAAMKALYHTIGESLDPERAPSDRLAGYRPLFTPRMSMNKIWDRLKWRGREPFNPRNE